MFASNLDILLPSYIKSASESVHQLHRTSPEAYSYLDYLDHLAHLTVQFCQYIMSKAASDINDIAPHQNDQRIAYIVLYEDEFRHLKINNKIQLTNIDPLTQAGFRTSTSTSIYVSRQQMRSTSRSHHVYFLAHMTRLRTTSRQQQLYLIAILAKTDKLGHAVFYVHTKGNHHNIRNSSSISLHQYSHCTSMRLGTS